MEITRRATSVARDGFIIVLTFQVLESKRTLFIMNIYIPVLKTDLFVRRGIREIARRGGRVRTNVRETVRRMKRFLFFLI